SEATTPQYVVYSTPQTTTESLAMTIPIVLTGPGGTYTTSFIRKERNAARIVAVSTGNQVADHRQQPSHDSSEDDQSPQSSNRRMRLRKLTVNASAAVARGPLTMHDRVLGIDRADFSLDARDAVARASAVSDKRSVDQPDFRGNRLRTIAQCSAPNSLMD